MLFEVIAEDVADYRSVRSISGPCAETDNLSTYPHEAITEENLVPKNATFMDQNMRKAFEEPQKQALKTKQPCDELLHANEIKQREHDSSKAPSTRLGRGHRVHVTHFEQRGGSL